MASILNNIRYNGYYQRAMVAYKKPEIKASFELILSIIVVSILIIAAIRPTLSNIASLQKKIEDIDSISKKADNKINQLTKFQDDLSDNVQILPRLNAAVADDLNYASITKRVEILAFEHKLKLDSIKLPGRPVAGDTGKLSAGSREKIKDAITPTLNNLVSVPVAISVTGSQQAVFDFARDLENMDRLAKIESLTIAKTSSLQTGTATLLRADIKSVFYSVVKQNP